MLTIDQVWNQHPILFCIAMLCIICDDMSGILLLFFLFVK